MAALRIACERADVDIQEHSPVLDSTGPYASHNRLSPYRHDTPKPGGGPAAGAQVGRVKAFPNWK